MIGKPIALLQIPNQRLFKVAAAAVYLGIHPQTLRDMTDVGEIPAKWMRNRRVYLLDDLDSYIESLPDYNPGMGGNPGSERRGNGNQ